MSRPTDAEPPTRRGLLAASLGLGATALAGCPSGRGSGDEGADGSAETRSPPSEPSPSPSPESASASVGRHDFWIANRTGTDHTVELAVTEAGTGRTVIDGCYESPGGLVIRFRDVGEEDVTYDVTASVAGSSSTLEDEWTPSACPDAYTGLYGTDGGVVIENGAVAFARNECDYAAVGNEIPELPPGDVESCARPTRTPQSVTTSSPSRTSTG